MVKFNNYQLEAAKYYKSSNGHLAIEARAGSGKTTFLLGLSKLKKSKEALFVAFTNATKETLIKRDKSLTDRVKTTYSLGYKALRNYLGMKLEVDNFKYHNILRDLLNSNTYQAMGEVIGFDTNKLLKRNELNALVDVINIAHLNLVGNNDEEVFNLINEDLILSTYEVAKGLIQGLIMKTIRLAANMVIEDGIISYSDMVSFMYYIPDGSEYFDKFPRLFVDETQDLSRAQHFVIESSMGFNAQLVLVGDSRQCQPKGTKVLCVNDQPNKKQETFYKNIEDVKEGDTVLSPVLSDLAYYRKKVKKTAFRPYKGLLIKVNDGENTSSYTPNHKVLLNYSNKKGKHYVYLMQQNDLFRVGKSYLHYDCKNTRSSAEKADRMWILGWYDEDNEARDEELYYSWDLWHTHFNV
jgi:hypothetical protein